ncbi:hypothetical protein LRR80_00217 [Streptomyces sp. RO-S4]|nr:hypothetical protein [Streptomyces sp. RO-S4]
MGIAQAEAQLAELAAQMAGVRFVERGGLLGEQVGYAFGLLVVMGRISSRSRTSGSISIEYRPLSIAPMIYGPG